MSKKDQKLFWAAFDGKLDKVQKLCGDSSVDVNWRCEGEITPFFGACEKGHVAIVKFLLTVQKVDPMIAENEGATPFFTVCSKGKKEIVSLLLADPRVDPNKGKQNGTSPFSVACWNGHNDVVLLLLADPRVDPNSPTHGGETLFFMACRNGHEGVVSLLLANQRVDPNKAADNQSTPLWIACQEGHLLIVKHVLASDKTIDTKKKSAFNKTTPAEHGRAMGARTKSSKESEDDFQRRKTNGPLCADLIEAYEKDPAKVRAEMKEQLGLSGTTGTAPEAQPAATKATWMGSLFRREAAPKPSAASLFQPAPTASCEPLILIPTFLCFIMLIFLSLSLHSVKPAPFR